MSHTPTPWVIGKYEDVYDAAGEMVPVKGFALSRQGEANAAFIVRAVNSHDRLVEALRLVRSIIVDGSPHGFNPLEGDWAERLYASQAATAKALRDAGEGL